MAISPAQPSPFVLMLLVYSQKFCHEDRGLFEPGTTGDVSRIIFSIPLILIGAFGLAGSDITFFMGGRQVTPQEGGQITLIVGIILLLVGIVITYIRRKKM